MFPLRQTITVLFASVIKKYSIHFSQPQRPWQQQHHRSAACMQGIENHTPQSRCSRHGRHVGECPTETSTTVDRLHVFLLRSQQEGGRQICGKSVSLGLGTEGLTRARALSLFPSVSLPLFLSVSLKKRGRRELRGGAVGGYWGH